jgi:aminocarboxymuconate-semialdehyde decarboxylase
MANRRDFMRVTAGGAAALLLSPGYAQGRREVQVAGRRVRVVDIHAHCVFPELADIIRGTEFERNFPASQVLGPGRIEEMNRRGIDVQVLSVNNYWWYPADRNLASRIIRRQDELLSAWCREHPDRFVALTSVAVQHPELAAEQLEYAVNELGLRGASVGGHCNGERLSDPRFDPFWAKAQELDVPVFMHPGGAENVIQENAWDMQGPGDLGNIVGNPLETTIFLSHMIFNGVFDRFPRLKVVAAHGGGFLTSYLGRTEVACAVRGDAECANTRLPSEYMRTNILSDSMVFSEEGIRHMVAETGAWQVVYGSDIPFNWPDTIDLIVNSPSLSNAEKEAILGGNLIRLLKIT